MNKKALVILISLFFVFGCVEEESDVGGLLLPEVDLAQISIFDSDSLAHFQYSKSFVKDINLGPATSVLMGRFNNLSAKMMLKFGFTLSTEIKSDIENDSLTILSAKLVLKPASYFGDNSGNFGFSGYKITSDWTSIDFTKDSLSTLQLSDSVYTQFSGIIDSSLSADISNDLVLEWMKADFKSSGFNNYGIILIPDDATNFIASFAAIPNNFSEFRPKIITEVLKSSGDIDTLTGEVFNDVHITEGTGVYPDPKMIYLQGNVASRGFIFYDQAFLPENAVINRAEFEIFADTTSTFPITANVDTIFVEMVSDSIDIEATDKFAGSVLIRQGEKYSGVLTNFYQQITNGFENFGMQFRISNETSTFNKAVLFGSDADITKRPRLKVYYTEKN